MHLLILEIEMVWGKTISGGLTGPLYTDDMLVMFHNNCRRTVD